jgi:hypothetical protein
MARYESGAGLRYHEDEGYLAQRARYRFDPVSRLNRITTQYIMKTLRGNHAACRSRQTERQGGPSASCLPQDQSSDPDRPGHGQQRYSATELVGLISAPCIRCRRDASFCGPTANHGATFQGGPGFPLARASSPNLPRHGQTPYGGAFSTAAAEPASRKRNLLGLGGVPDRGLSSFSPTDIATGSSTAVNGRN